VVVQRETGFNVLAEAREGIPAPRYIYIGALAVLLAVCTDKLVQAPISPLKPILK
jgi:hypothetical protein